MNNPINKYWELKLEQCKNALERNNFEVYIADDPAAAKETVVNVILPEIDVKLVSYGDSLTLFSSGILEYLRRNSHIQVIDTFDDRVSFREIVERRRQALLADLFFTGTNALTEAGQLVNLDMIGNRIAGLTFGPRYVVILIGRNKIVSDLGEAMERIRNYAAPANAIRHNMKTPCVKTARCMDCKSRSRICNVWTIHEKSYPRGRIKIILINRDLGL